MPGNLLGPEIMSECLTEDTSLPRGNSYNWIYGHCDVNECEMGKTFFYQLRFWKHCIVSN